jgi:DNA primase small subunit
MDIEYEDKMIIEMIEQEEKEKQKEKEQMEKNQKLLFNKPTKEMLKYYYENLFPTKAFFNWLGKSKPEEFECREISFTLENDIYLRYLCFYNDEEFKKELIKRTPEKIDIGAKFNTLPKLNKTISEAKNFYPVSKELVFDIDMTDYDIIRTCCNEANICNKCWKFMIVAYEILNDYLIEDFGFEKIMWFFSGRRGIHCWVSDERARILKNDGRSSIANFIKIRYVTKSGLKYDGILKGYVNIHPSVE